MCEASLGSAPKAVYVSHRVVVTERSYNRNVLVQRLGVIKAFIKRMIRSGLWYGRDVMSNVTKLRTAFKKCENPLRRGVVSVTQFQVR